MFSKFERLSLLNQFRILDTVQPGQNWASLATILERGFESEYYQLDQWLSEPLAMEDCQFVYDVLRLFDALQRRYGMDKDAVPAEVAFPGFDGNNEGELLSFLRFLREDQGKYTYLKMMHGEGLNSHFPTRRKYQQMLAVWNSLGQPEAEMTESHRTAILSARA